MARFTLSVLILFVIQNQVSSNQDLVIATAQEIIRYTFKSNDYCIVSATEKCDISDYVEQALMKLKISTYHTTFEDLLSFSKKIQNCGGYLLALKNITNLKNIFSLDSAWKETFTNNKRFLVFLQSRRKYTEFKFLNSAYLRGSEVIVVHGLTAYSKKRFKQQTFRKLQVTFTWEYKTITVLNDKIKNVIPEYFETRPWKPKLRRAFRVSSFHCPPFVLYKENKGAYGGTEYNLIKEITKEWPVEYIFYNSNAWKEIVDAVAERKSDLAMCSLWQVSTRSVAASYPYSQICVTFLVSKPQLLADIFYVFQPIQLTLWILIIVVLFLVSSLLHLLMIVRNRLKLNEVHEVSYKTDIITTLFDTIRLLTLGGLVKTPNSAEYYLRYILISFSITCMILSTAYSAGFASSLTYPRYSKPVQTIDDMIEQNVQIEVEEHQKNIKDVFKEFADPRLGLLAEYIVSTPENKSHGDSSKYAKIVKVAGYFVTDTEQLDSYSKTHLHLLKECISEMNIVFALQHNSPFMSFVNKHIGRLVEHGFLKYWFKQSIYLSGNEFDYMNHFFSVYVDSFEQDALKLKKLQGAFILLAVGITIAIFGFFIEVFYYKVYQIRFL